MTNKAIVSHQTTGRIRIKIPSRRGDKPYFSALRSEFGEKYGTVGANPSTGSLVVESESIDPGEIAAWASEKGLFELDVKKRNVEPLFRKISVPIVQVNTGIRKISGGDFDLPGALFMLLVGFGAFELIRGNFKTPPWYTAFWYAFGMFSKYLLDRR